MPALNYRRKALRKSDRYHCCWPNITVQLLLTYVLGVGSVVHHLSHIIHHRHRRHAMCEFPLFISAGQVPRGVATPGAAVRVCFEAFRKPTTVGTAGNHPFYGHTQLQKACVCMCDVVCECIWSCFLFFKCTPFIPLFLTASKCRRIIES